MFIDTHCHFFKEYYDNFDDVIKKSKDNNVDIYISAGVDRLTNLELLKTINDYKEIYCCLGIHPEYANSYSDEDIKFIEDNIKNPKVVAIGEIGLDYHYEGYDKEKQIELFEKQLLLAEKNNMKVVIHSRDAIQDTINILKKYKVTGVIHSFSGSLEIAKEYIKMGYKLGINGVVTFKNAHIKDIIQSIGLENILLETDSPYLTPEPFRGQTNYPSNIYAVAKFLSEYLNVDLNDIMNITTNSALCLFNKIMI